MRRVAVILVPAGLIFGVLALAIKPHRLADWLFIAAFAFVLWVVPTAGKALSTLRWRRQITPTGGQVPLAGDEMEDER